MLYNLRRKRVGILIRLYRDCPRDCFPVLNALADEIERRGYRVRFGRITRAHSR